MLLELICYKKDKKINPGKEPICPLRRWRVKKCFYTSRQGMRVFTLGSLMNHTADNPYLVPTVPSRLEQKVKTKYSTNKRNKYNTEVTAASESSEFAPLFLEGITTTLDNDKYVNKMILSQTYKTFFVKSNYQCH